MRSHVWSVWLEPFGRWVLWPLSAVDLYVDWDSDRKLNKMLRHYHILFVHVERPITK